MASMSPSRHAMSDACPRTPELLDHLTSGATDPDDPIWQHVGACDACARAIARHLIAADAPDEDDLALADAELADETTRARVERARGLDPAFAPEPPTAHPSARWPLLLAAAAALIAAVAALLLRPAPPEPGLIARGPAVDAEVELLIGEATLCRTATPDALPCRWSTAAPLTVHYRAPAPVHAAVVIRDAEGDWSRLFPDVGGTGPLPACTGEFCPLTGGEFDAPAGPAELVVLLFDTPRDAAAVDAALAGDAPPDAAHRFALRVE